MGPAPTPTPTPTGEEPGRTGEPPPSQPEESVETGAFPAWVLVLLVVLGIGVLAAAVVVLRRRS